MGLIDALCFDMVGSLITSQGINPTFLRYTIANAESEVNGSWRLFTAAVHQPRFTSTGAILLEQSSTNLLTYPLDLRHSSWVKGSSINVLPDLVQAMDNNYLADVVSVAAYTGNDAANTLSKSFTFGSGLGFTVSAYLSLLGGRLGAQDVLRVTGDVASPQSIQLGGIFNDRPGNYRPVTFTFKTAGSPPATYLDAKTQRTVNLELYCRNAVSLAWAGAQLEPGPIRTTFIGQTAQITSRDRDYLNYPKSPVQGLSSFLCYVNLEVWRGNGVIATAGNFVLEIVGGKVRATCGVVTVTDPDPLPDRAKIAVRVSQGLTRVSIYVNGVMKARETLSSYTANTSTLTIAGEGVRQIRCLYFFNRDVSDGSIDVGQSVLGELLTLHSQDSLLTDLAEGYSRIVLPRVRVPAKGETAVRYPQFQRASQTISSITPGGGAVAQQDTITVRTIANAAASQTDSVTINGTVFEFVSDATPTPTESAAGLATKINTVPKAQPVTATATAGSFTITADVAGDDFSVSVSSRLSREATIANQPATNTVAVSNAVDFTRGPAQIFRDYAFVIDVAITNVNTTTNQLTLTTLPNSQFALIQQGDTILQPSWSLKCGPNNVFCHHLEDFPDILVSGKSPEGFRFRNTGLIERQITPSVKITL
ncbi:hypothetical protein H6F43_04105 [Leptolyngbya sp. FACHB-36]|uniref:phage head spike fiber domain-containing protein n=1 Tax=Leptolyngbya sp. FACHB-36 TaxID=2692808 RepID=UPI0016800507|nr:hypothetical protein [Leptolyngbya sp. FACHB-36]MBD2019366.1 hypothetical protein [Leptolyngbya sp. FACHB-36]